MFVFPDILIIMLRGRMAIATARGAAGERSERSGKQHKHNLILDDDDHHYHHCDHCLIIIIRIRTESEINRSESTAAKAGSEIIVLYNVKSILTDNSI